MVSFPNNYVTLNQSTMSFHLNNRICRSLKKQNCSELTDYGELGTPMLNKQMCKWHEIAEDYETTLMSILKCKTNEPNNL